VKHLLVTFGCIFVMSGWGTSGTSAADANHGKDLAQRWCASCHLAAPEQRQASTDAPTFSAVARAPKFDAARLAYFLLEPHPKMPDMALSRAEAQDLAAYIATLRSTPRRPR
jgi:mono/diheme cytochrome c family protein